MEDELQFLIMADCCLSHSEFIEKIREKLSNTTNVRPRSFKWSGNWIQIWENEDFDSSLAGDAEDGFLYYRYRVEVSPIEKDLKLDDQIRIAKVLESKLKELNCKFQICAGFEGLLR